MTRPLWLVALLATTSCLITPNPCADCAGCCSQGVCVSGTQSSACGKGGADCFDCGQNLCTAGVCASGGAGGGTSTGGGSGGSGGGLTGGGGGGTGGGVSGGGGGASSPCTTGLTWCAARCVSTQGDRDHCGQCGRSCTTTQACVSGQCVANPADCRQAQCLPGFYCDLSNGACREGCASNTQCPQPGTCDTASRTCACEAGSQRCGDACAPSSSTDACGASCIRCEKANATAACTAGACVYTCNPGFHRCGADCAADDSITQCGASCGACPTAPANGSAECVLQPGTGGGAGGGGGGAAMVRGCDFFCAPGFLKCGTGCCRAVALAAGGTHTCAVTTAGTVKCWGNLERSTKPVDVEGFDAGVTALTAGTNHTCALRTDGRAVCWGGNDYGQLGDNSGTPSYRPVDVSGSLTFSSLSAGGFSTCGVTTAGAAKCWGDNPYGQVGNGTYSPTSCTVGDCHFFDVPYSVVGLGSGVATVSSGWGHACARMTTGAVSCWGRNYFGELGAATPSRSSVPLAAVLSDASVLAAGDMNTCAINPTGLLCWGGNFDGSLGIGTTMHSPTPVTVGLGGVTNVWGGMGGVHCATSSAGLSCWGQNNRGQVGDGTMMSRSLPTPVAIGPVSAVVTGDEHTCALSQGAVYCWGANSEGQLGDGTYTNRAVPTVVSGH